MQCLNFLPLDITPKKAPGEKVKTKKILILVVKPIQKQNFIYILWPISRKVLPVVFT
jgi:hypothetical protein